MKKNLLLIAGVLFLSTVMLTSCGSKDEKKDEDKKEDSKESEEAKGEESEATEGAVWAQSMQDAYVNSCVSSAKGSMSEELATEYCNCTLGKIMAKYPDPAAMQTIGQEEITSLAMECMTAEMMAGAVK